MTFKFPWDQGTDGVRTRLVEDPDHGYAFEYEGENSADHDYRHNRRTDGTRGYGETREWREVAHMSNAEALEFWRQTGINPFDPNNAQAVVDLLNRREWQLMRTIEGKIGRVFKD